MDVTEIITPEVLAAIDRLKRFESTIAQSGHTAAINSVYGGSHIKNTIDVERVKTAMLTLFPGDMPEPVEMWADENFGMRSAYDCRTGENIRGIFIPLQRVDQ